MEHTLAQLQQPSACIYSELGGAPLYIPTADDGQRQSVEQQWQAALALLLQLHQYIEQLPVLSLPAEEDATQPAPQEYRYFGIVEIQEVADEGPTPQQQRLVLIQQVLLALLLYAIPDTAPVVPPACTWQADRGTAAAAGGSSSHSQHSAGVGAVAPAAAASEPQDKAGSLPGLVGCTFLNSLQLRTPWTCQQVSAAALEQLRLLGATTPGLLTQDSPAASTNRRQQQQEQEHEADGSSHLSSIPAAVTSRGGWLLARVLPGVLQQLRPALTAQHQHDVARDKGQAAAYKGPGVFDRCLAARQLACAVQLLPPAALEQHLGLLLPLLLAAVDDPSPAVQRYGHAGVHWLAATVGTAQLGWQRELLLHVANKMVVGCDPAVWSTALPAATQLVLALDSSSSKGATPRSAALDTLLQELVTEAERSGDKPDLRAAFLACLAVLLPAVRLYVVKHLGRILPLLLEWLLLGSASSQAAAAEVLREVVRWSWPRMSAHVGVVWQYMAAAAQAEDAAAEEEARWVAWRQAAEQGERGGGGKVPHYVNRAAAHAGKASALLELMEMLVQAAPAAVREAVQQQAQGQTAADASKLDGLTHGLLPTMQALAMQVPAVSS